MTTNPPTSSNGDKSDNQCTKTYYLNNEQEIIKASLSQTCKFAQDFSALDDKEEIILDKTYYVCLCQEPDCSDCNDASQPANYSSKDYDSQLLDDQVVRERHLKVYFDNGATTLRPKAVVSALENVNNLMGNPERSTGTNQLSSIMKLSKELLTKYIDPQANPKNLVFTAGATDSLNLIASVLTRFYRQQLVSQQKAGEPDNQYYILIAESNHHANILPWVKLCEEIPQIKLLRMKLDNRGRIDLDNLAYQAASLGGKLLLCTYSTVVNSNGVRNHYYAIKQILQHYAPDCFIVLDNAQGTTYNEQIFPMGGCYDFVVGSIHKMYGPTGLGYLLTSQRIQDLAYKPLSPLGKLQQIMSGWKKEDAIELQETDNKTGQAHNSRATAHNNDTSDVATIGNDLTAGTSFAKALITNYCLKTKQLAEKVSGKKKIIHHYLEKFLNSCAESTQKVDCEFVTQNIYRDSLYSFNLESLIHKLQAHPNFAQIQVDKTTPSLNIAIDGNCLQAERVGGGNVTSIHWSQELYDLDIPNQDIATLTASNLRYEFADNNPFYISGTNNYYAVSIMPVLINWLKSHNKFHLYHATHFLINDLKRRLADLPGVVFCRDLDFAQQVIASNNYLLLLLPSEGHTIWMMVNDDYIDDDLATQFLLKDILIRVGKHCCHLLHQRYNFDQTLRISSAPFITPVEVEYCYQIISNFIKSTYDNLSVDVQQQLTAQESQTPFTLLEELYT